MRPGRDPEVRTLLEETVGESVTDAQWEYLSGRGYLSKVLAFPSTMTIEELADEYEELLSAFGGSVAIRKKDRRVRLRAATEEPDDPKNTDALRRWVVEVMIAQEAASDGYVEDFRSKRLNNALLTAENLEGWIRQQIEADGPPNQWVRVQVPPEHQVREEEMGSLPNGPRIVGHFVDPPFIVRYADGPAEMELLAYSTPPDWEPRTAPVAVGGVLWELRRASNWLAYRYGWTPAQATVFVLTNLFPDLPPVTERIHRRSPSVLDRITLTVDPVLSPREVAEQYARVRERVVGPRHRELSQKHLKLALFTAGPLAKAAKTWAERMALWNTYVAKPSEWDYTNWRMFARDYDQARKRLLDAFPRRSAAQPMGYELDGGPVEAGQEQAEEDADAKG